MSIVIVLNSQEYIAQGANDEIKFCIDVQLKLESMSYEIFKKTNELKQTKNYFY